MEINCGCAETESSKLTFSSARLWPELGTFATACDFTPLVLCHKSETGPPIGRRNCPFETESGRYEPCPFSSWFCLAARVGATNAKPSRRCRSPMQVKRRALIRGLTSYRQRRISGSIELSRNAAHAPSNPFSKRIARSAQRLRASRSTSARAYYSGL